MRQEDYSFNLYLSNTFFKHDVTTLWTSVIREEHWAVTRYIPMYNDSVGNSTAFHS